MKLLVLISLAYNSYRTDAPGSGICPAHGATVAMNRFDEHALEQALQIRDQHHEAVVDVICQGPEPAAGILKRALGMGADNALHLFTRDYGLIPASLSAARIEAVIREKHYDLILTGIVSQDAMQGQVGPMLAARLNRSCVTSVVGLEWKPASSTLELRRESARGSIEIIQCRFPVLISVHAGINTPRYPSVSKLLAADRKSIETVSVNDLPTTGALSNPTTVWTGMPAKTRAGTIASGPSEETSTIILSDLTRRNLL